MAKPAEETRWMTRKDVQYCWLQMTYARSGEERDRVGHKMDQRVGGTDEGCGCVTFVLSPRYYIYIISLFF